MKINGKDDFIIRYYLESIEVFLGIMFCFQMGRRK